MRCEKCHSEIPDGAERCPHCDAKQANAAVGYAAFISYRHLPRDQEVAKQIQKAIETYKLPRGISMQGRSDGRLGKCFRDEDELSAAHSLPDRILDALAKSSSLIVVCSPEARDSVWINREITAFIQMHGRERVFAVLADGSTDESIPMALRTQAMVPGSAEVTPANPLAADFRPQATDKKRDETLRIIAAVAGCNYDDLRQRNRSRTMKRGAVIAVAVIVVIAAIVAALIFASSARQAALEAESLQLAAESTQLLARGDRYGAIQKALQALPQSEAAADRPILPEARTALEDALEINANPNSTWWASYEITTQAPLGLLGNTLAHKTDEAALAGAIAVSDTGGFFAISDTAGNISTYDTLTGKKLADCIMPEEATPLASGLYTRLMAATENYLVVTHGGERNVLACFDATTGDIVWSQLDAGGPSFGTSYGGDLLSMAFPLTEGGYSVTIANLATSETSSVTVGDVERVDTSSAYFNTPGDRLGTNYAAFGNRLSKVELDGGEPIRTELAYANVTSLKYFNGLIVAASADPMPEDGITRRYAIEAFDENLNLKWRHDGTFASEMIVNNGITSLLAAEPVIYGTTEADDAGAIVASVGRKVLIFNPTDGAIDESALSGQLTFDQSVADVSLVAGAPDDPGFITVACSSGMVNSMQIVDAAQDPNADARRLTLPFPIRWAHVTHCGDYEVVIAVPADADNRIVSYRTDWSRGQDTGGDYSLDELIALANLTLAEGGRT